MLSRRKFTTIGSAALCIGIHDLKALPSDQRPKATTDKDEDVEGVSKYVDIRIGTGGHGHCYPGATVPYGMVQLSPDTYNRGWDWCSGYNYSDDSIMGFSHTHLSGTGIGDMLDVLVMPCTGAVKTEPGTREDPKSGYRSRFSHSDEHAVPGYYSVLLRDYGIQAELTATARVGVHRYTFPKSDESYIIVDLAHGYDDGPRVVLWSDLKVVDGDTLVGGKSTGRWANGREIYFAMKFSQPFHSIDLLVDGQMMQSPSGPIQGKSIKAVLHYKTEKGQTLLVKTGISGVSSQGAMQNLAAEVPHWDFDQIRQQAAHLWEQNLSRIHVEGGTQRQKQIFYTSLYHCFLAPTLFDDVDGSYRGMDGANHKLASGAQNFSTYSLWDTYRALHPLTTVVQSERVPEFINCLIRMAKESPVGMPIWPLQAKETKCMTGYHSAPVIAEAIVKGIPGINIQDAYSVMKKEAMDSDVRGLPLYRQYGYIPCDLYSQSVSTSLDYCYDDWAVACVAKAAGVNDVAKTLRERSLTYRALYDSETGFMRPKLATGEWALPFAANEMGHSKKWRDYTESNPWETTFAVQHDPKGLANLMGGRDKLEAKLDGIFNASSELPADAPSDIAGLIGQYAHGNEPSHHIAYLYLYTGAPYKAQSRVYELMEAMYKNEPDGLAGNEDCGQMSAWYVMSAMGFYAVDPISGNYVFGTPLFDRVTVRVGQGKELVIEAQRSAPADKFIHSISWNGRPYDKLWFTHEDLKTGGHFTLRMGSQPNTSFGTNPELAPPSVSS
jgi:predicted alpha-1,2-mannosidase